MNPFDEELPFEELPDEVIWEMSFPGPDDRYIPGEDGPQVED